MRSSSKQAQSPRRSVFLSVFLSILAHFVGHAQKRPRRASRHRPHQGKQEIARRRRRMQAA